MPWSDYYVQGKEVSLLEEWKDILGYEGHYQVSNHGRVRSVKRNSTIILKGDCQPNGYKRVYLWKDGRKKNFLVHRLVGLSFLDNPNHYSDINHLDENQVFNGSYQEIIESINVSKPTVVHMFQQLIKVGILEKIKNKQYRFRNTKLVGEE